MLGLIFTNIFLWIPLKTSKFEHHYIVVYDFFNKMQWSLTSQKVSGEVENNSQNVTFPNTGLTVIQIPASGSL